MKNIVKFYPKGKVPAKEIAIKAKKENLQGLAIPMPYNKGNNSSEYTNLVNLKNELEKEKLELGLIAPFFYAPEIWEKYPNKRAKKSDVDWPSLSWYKPLCPIYPGLFEERLALLEEAVNKINPVFIGLDFFRFPLFWEELDDHMILKTCSCKGCSSLDKRTAIIYQMAKEVKKRLPNLLITIHLVPFIDTKTTKITGQDPKLLAQAIDSLSPMLYNNLLKKEPDFIINTLLKQEDYTVWPSLEIAWKDNLYLQEALTKYARILYFHWPD